MRLSLNLIAPIAIVLAAGLSVLSAIVAVRAIEDRAVAEINHALTLEGIDWVGTEPDGMIVRLYGTAPTEAERFRALSVTGTIIDASRVIDEMEVTPANPIKAPKFSMELLRNDAGVSLVGLVPGEIDRGALTRAVAKAAGQARVTDLLESANFPAPEGWQKAVDFGLKALKMLPRSKISISAGAVSLTAITDAAKEKNDAEKALARALPRGVTLEMDISAPRPVITPFTLRFVIDAGEVRFDACSADTEAARDRILAAARKAGLTDGDDCTLGLGVPSPKWADAVETGIGALAQLGGGTLTFSDADVTLVALESTEQALFDRVIGETETALPEVFSLHSVKPQPKKIRTSDDPNAIPEFSATRSPEGLVQLRGRVPDDLVRNATESFAQARFGRDNVYAAMRLDPDLPEGWPMRVLASLEALSGLTNGSVLMDPDLIELRGTTHDKEASARIAQLFASKLGEAQDFKIEVNFVPIVKADDRALTGEQCVAQIAEILATSKITFAPGSVTVEGASVRVVGDIAKVLRECPDAKIEIAGHTDSQGREEMNLQLSQQRAEGVLSALLARRILTSNITAKGYGESRPIADNGTEEGREANRRIEFTLIQPASATDADGETALDAQAAAPAQDTTQPQPEATDAQH